MAVRLRIVPPSAAATSSPVADEQAFVGVRMSPVVELVVCLVVVAGRGRAGTVVIGCVVRTSTLLIR